MQLEIQNEQDIVDIAERNPIHNLVNSRRLEPKKTTNSLKEVLGAIAFIALGKALFNLFVYVWDISSKSLFH